LVAFAHVQPWAEGEDISSAGLHALEEAFGLLGSLPCAIGTVPLPQPSLRLAVLPPVLAADACTTTRAWR